MVLAGAAPALVGMQGVAHVEENLALAHRPLLAEDVIRSLFERSSIRYQVPFRP